MLLATGSASNRQFVVATAFAVAIRSLSLLDHYGRRPADNKINRAPRNLGVRGFRAQVR